MSTGSLLYMFSLYMLDGVAAPCDTIKVIQMAMPQRDETIEEIKRLDALLEYAVMHGDEAEAERLREALKRLTDSI